MNSPTKPNFKFDDKGTASKVLKDGQVDGDTGIIIQNSALNITEATLDLSDSGMIGIDSTEYFNFDLSDPFSDLKKAIEDHEGTYEHETGLASPGDKDMTVVENKELDKSYFERLNVLRQEEDLSEELTLIYEDIKGYLYQLDKIDKEANKLQTILIKAISMNRNMPIDSMIHLMEHIKLDRDAIELRQSEQETMRINEIISRHTKNFLKVINLKGKKEEREKEMIKIIQSMSYFLANQPLKYRYMLNSYAITEIQKNILFFLLVGGKLHNKNATDLKTHLTGFKKVNCLRNSDLKKILENYTLYPSSFNLEKGSKNKALIDSRLVDLDINKLFVSDEFLDSGRINFDVNQLPDDVRDLYYEILAGGSLNENQSYKNVVIGKSDPDNKDIIPFGTVNCDYLTPEQINEKLRKFEILIQEKLKLTNMFIQTENLRKTKLTELSQLTDINPNDLNTTFKIINAGNTNIQSQNDEYDRLHRVRISKYQEDKLNENRKTQGERDDMEKIINYQIHNMTQAILSGDENIINNAVKDISYFLAFQPLSRWYHLNIKGIDGIELMKLIKGVKGKELIDIIKGVGGKELIILINLLDSIKGNNVNELIKLNKLVSGNKGKKLIKLMKGLQSIEGIGGDKLIELIESVELFKGKELDEITEIINGIGGDKFNTFIESIRLIKSNQLLDILELIELVKLIELANGHDRIDGDELINSINGKEIINLIKSIDSTVGNNLMELYEGIKGKKLIENKKIKINILFFIFVKSDINTKELIKIHTLTDYLQFCNDGHPLTTYPDRFDKTSKNYSLIARKILKIDIMRLFATKHS